LLAFAQSRSNVLKIPLAVYSTISVWRGTSTEWLPTKIVSAAVHGMILVELDTVARGDPCHLAE